MSEVSVIELVDLNKKTTASNSIEPIVSLPEACWDISLNCDCPKCGGNVDLMDDADFWENNRIQACEHGTKASSNIGAYCKACEHEFKVDLAY
jgi:hypothetical protein